MCVGEGSVKQCMLHCTLHIYTHTDRMLTCSDTCHLSHSVVTEIWNETQNSKAWSDGRLIANMEWSQQTWNGASKWSLQQATGTQQ